MHRDRVFGERVLQLGSHPARLVRGAVGLGDDHETRAVGDAERIGVARIRQRDGVEVLDRRGHDPGAEHTLDRADPCFRVAVEADHRQLELRRGDQPQPRRGDEAERALGADEQALQVVTGDVLSDGPPMCTISPGGITASRPVTQWPVTPYLKACGPPALQAMFPPI